MRNDQLASRTGGIALWGVILLAVGVRLMWGISRPASDEVINALPDQVEYLTLARNLLHGQGLSFVDPRFGARVYAFRMPGYPFLVAACAGNVQTVRLVQAIVDTSTVLAVYFLARLLMPGGAARPAIFAAMFAACNPLLIYFSGMILSETLFAAMLTWGMILLLLGFGSDDRPGRAPIWLLGGFVLALAVLVRPSAGLLPVVLGVAGLFVNHEAKVAYHSSRPSCGFDRRPIPVGAAMLLLVGLVLTPWVLRNYRVLHHVIFGDTNAGITLYDGYNAAATGASDQTFVKRMPQLQLMDEMGRSQYLALAATDFIKHHPRRVVELILAKAERTWSPVPLSDQFGNMRNRAILLLYSVPFDLMVIAGLCIGTLRRPAKVFLLLPAVYLTIVHALTVGSLRYRLPAEPALAVLAASAFYRPTPVSKSTDSMDRKDGFL